MKPPIRIITDSVADLPWDIAQRLDIAVIPIYLLLAGDSYRADEQLESAWFYEQLAQRNIIPQTAAPPPVDFLHGYQHLVTEGAQDIIGLFLCASLSSITANAQVAAQQLMEQTSARVHIVETAQVSMGVGNMAIAAAQAAAQGATVPHIIHTLENMRQRTVVLGMLNSLEHLRKGGRVGWAAARLVDFLQIKPMVSFIQGEAHLAGRVRTYRRALNRLIDVVHTAQPLEHLTIIHSRVEPTTLTRLQHALQDCAPSSDPVPIVEVGPIFGTHVGPRGIGVTFVQAQ